MDVVSSGGKLLQLHIAIAIGIAIDDHVSFTYEYTPIVKGGPSCGDNDSWLAYLFPLDSPLPGFNQAVSVPGSVISFMWHIIFIWFVHKSIVKFLMTFVKLQLSLSLLVVGCRLSAVRCCWWLVASSQFPQRHKLNFICKLFSSSSPIKLYIYGIHFAFKLYLAIL